METAGQAGRGEHSIEHLLKRINSDELEAMCGKDYSPSLPNPGQPLPDPRQAMEDWLVEHPICIPFHIARKANPPLVYSVSDSDEEAEDKDEEAEDRDGSVLVFSVSDSDDGDGRILPYDSPSAASVNPSPSPSFVLASPTPPPLSSSSYIYSSPSTCSSSERSLPLSPQSFTSALPPLLPSSSDRRRSARLSRPLVPPVIPVAHHSPPAAARRSPSTQPGPSATARRTPLPQPGSAVPTPGSPSEQAIARKRQQLGGRQDPRQEPPRCRLKRPTDFGEKVPFDPKMPSLSKSVKVCVHYNAKLAHGSKCIFQHVCATCRQAGHTRLDCTSGMCPIPALPDSSLIHLDGPHPAEGSARKAA